MYVKNNFKSTVVANTVSQIANSKLELTLEIISSNFLCHDPRARPQHFARWWLSNSCLALSSENELIGSVRWSMPLSVDKGVNLEGNTLSLSL